MYNQSKHNLQRIKFSHNSKVVSEHLPIDRLDICLETVLVCPRTFFVSSPPSSLRYDNIEACFEVDSLAVDLFLSVSSSNLLILILTGVTLASRNSLLATFFSGDTFLSRRGGYGYLPSLHSQSEATLSSFLSLSQIYLRTIVLGSLSI